MYIKPVVVFSFLTLACCLPFSSIGKTESYRYVLNGYVGIEGGESFKYQLLLNDSAGELHGIAYTYSAAAKRVTARVAGQRLPHRQGLYIRETAILANEGFQSKAVICLINATLKIDSVSGTLRGPIITQTAEEGATCSKGSISLIRPEEISAIFKTSTDTSTTGKPSPTPPPGLVRSRPAAPVTAGGNPQPPPGRRGGSAVHREPQQAAPAKEITAGRPQDFFWNSDKVVLRIWDDKDPDGDRVSILLNDRTVLENHPLTAEKKTLVLDLPHKTMNTLTIQALNNGSMPPNTAYIVLYDGETEYTVIAHNTPGKHAVIRLKKQD